jgi:hypothetical protein
VTNTILCSNKIRIGRQLAIQSAKKEYAYSFYNNKNISFNVIDPRLASLEPDDNLETNTLGSDVIENGVIETDLDTVYSSNIQNKIDKNSNSKENLHKQLTGIRKYINSF